ncbi:hypothetical protein LQT46_24600 (plasmid) [Escherichia coli]|nr:hypothetical protein LQT46_24600 [Escherichia coli]
MNAWLDSPEYAISASLRAKMRSGWKNADPSGVIDSCLQRLLNVARTIADIDQSDIITRQHLQEAVSYRAIDRLLIICKTTDIKKRAFRPFY